MYVLYNCLRYFEEVLGIVGVFFISFFWDFGVKDEMFVRYVNNNNDKFYIVRLVGSEEEGE